VLKKAFTVYFSTKRTGTGLGLATSRRFIEEHDGTITVQSQPGKGSCFRILLPVDGPADVLRDAGAQRQERRNT
jgi:signal transduction histidine kinase